MYLKSPLFFFFLSILLPFLISCLPNPDPATVQPLLTTPSPPATIPAFPEQSSDVADCPLDLPEQLFHSIKTACGASEVTDSGQLQHSRCCPVLATWLYAAYSATALSRAGRVVRPAVPGHTQTYDLPLLPDDSETCVDGLGKALKQRGIELAKPNETCDLVYCYCGIRLHPLSCPGAFLLNHEGELVGDNNVKRLERDCLSSSTNVDGFPGLGGCNKCLSSLYLLNKKARNTSKLEDRPTKMRNKDCQLMGLTWLLAKNRTTYIHTVTAVIRAMMMSKAGSDPRSCTLNSDGMPLAVDSYEVSDHSSEYQEMENCCQPAPALHDYMGQAAARAAEAKLAKHDQACKDNQHSFIPFAFDTFGFLASDAVEFLRRVQKVMNRNVMTACSVEYVFRRIGFAIQRGLAAQLVARLPRTSM